MIKKPKRRKKTERQKYIKKLDTLASQLVKKRDKYTCVRCHKQYEEGARQLTCSHFWSRRNMGTRWDLDNLDCLCIGCHLHQWEHEKQGDYRDYMLKKLGEEKYTLLEVKARTVTKYNATDLAWLYEELLKIGDNLS